MHPSTESTSSSLAACTNEAIWLSSSNLPMSKKRDKQGAAWLIGKGEGAQRVEGRSPMAAAVRTFGNYLRHFTRSVDIVDDRIFEAVRQLVYKYVRDELGATYFSLACTQVVNDVAVLKTLWSSEGEEHFTPIRSSADEYHSQISVSFGQQKPLWIVNPDRRPLRETHTYVDLWSNITNLPPYREPVNRDLRTSIVVPLVHWDRVLGVIYLETASYLEITEVAKDELRLLADALAILYDLQQANRAQATGTRDAISELQDILSTTKFPRLTKPQIFIASSSRADDQVLAIIQEVLDEYSDRLNVVLWSRIEESGSITLQIVEEIAKSRFGMCYFSEPAPASEHRFRDNPNVVFEAGMLHSLTNSPAGRPAGWIPIREGVATGSIRFRRRAHGNCAAEDGRRSHRAAASGQSTAEDEPTVE